MIFTRWTRLALLLLLGACSSSPPKPLLPDGSHRVPVNAAAPVPPTSEFAGAPPEKAPPVVAPAPIPTEPRSTGVVVYFAFGDSSLDAKARGALERFAKEVNASRRSVIVIRGHADRIGDAAYNHALSVRRAASVDTFLTALGVSAHGRVFGVGADEASTHCESKNHTERLDCMQADRQVEVRLEEPIR